MDLYLDTEFLERYQKTGWFGKAKHTVDLISIAVYSPYGSGKSFYRICKDFNLNLAWKDEWIKKNVLKPIWRELQEKYCEENMGMPDEHFWFTPKSLKCLIQKYGFTKQEIGEDLATFINFISFDLNDNKVNFYGYCCAYDWVALCSLYGRMLDLPELYPMYCGDLKFMRDKLQDRIIKVYGAIRKSQIGSDVEMVMDGLKKHPNYPWQPKDEQHNALSDAKWNSELHEFLKYIERTHFLLDN